MSFIIDIKKESSCKNHKFSIYHHELSMEDLDNYIIQIMFEEKNLHQLFEPNTTFEFKKRLNQLRRFIETDFKNEEIKITDKEIQDRIEANINPTYFSFFAEALLARLNIDYIDNKLITGVISITDTIKTVSTGADVCMYSDENLVIGEAKFYNELNGGLNAILNDSSFSSKLESYCNNVIASDIEIILKQITGDVTNKTTEEIKRISFVFTGFILHTKSKRDNYETHYSKIENIVLKDMPSHFRIHLYHLPINSKQKLIYKIQRTALDLIVELKERLKND